MQELVKETITMRPVSQPESPASLTRQAYNALAGAYTQRTDEIGIAKQFDEFAGMLPLKRILDAGCGPGRDVATMLEKGYHAVGVDTSEDMLRIAGERARRLLQSRGAASIDQIVKDMFHQAELQNLPVGQKGFEKESYGGVWAVTSVQHVPKAQLPQFLAGSKALLAQKGILYIKTRAPFDGQPRELYECMETSSENGMPFTRFFAYYVPLEMIADVKDAGFSIIKTSKGPKGIEFPSVNSGEQGYKFWLMAQKR